MDDGRQETIGSYPAPNIERCIYGFVLFLISLSCLVLYYLWAFIPRRWIETITGITYMPSKYWAISIPIFFLFSIILFGMFLYPSMVFMLTPSLTDVSTVYDSYHLYNKSQQSLTGQKHSKTLKGIPPINDLPLDYVCSELYLKKNL